MNSTERIDYIFEAGSVTYRNSPQESNFLFGYGSIGKRKVYFVATNDGKNFSNTFAKFKEFTVFLESILSDPAPLILLLDILPAHHTAQRSPVPEDPDRLLADRYGVGRWYHLQARLSGRVPQVCAVFARMGATLTFPIALCDAVAMLSDAGMSIGRSDVVEKMMGEKPPYEKLGGAGMHAEKSGSIDFIGKRDEDILLWAQRYIEYLPLESGRPLPSCQAKHVQRNLELEKAVPANANVMLDMDRLIRLLSDEESFFELRQDFAREIITGFARFDGKVAGVIGNRSAVRGGILFPESCQKAARFISICDAFGIPLVFLADAPGFMVGSQVESAGIIKSAALLFSAISNAATARLSVIVRRGYTAGVYAMAGGGMEPDRFIALPTAIISIYGEVVASRLDPDNAKERENLKKMLETATNPGAFVEQGLIEAIVPMEDLRREIIAFLAPNQDGKRASKRPVLLV
ncbi:MAG: acyl-CoA carboxylase subunit beta [Deltaproteobacteria bacterium]|nr:acyl-CoA carboxylase subunit beta [Deltaproteobacteria bacterium]